MKRRNRKLNVSIALNATTSSPGTDVGAVEIRAVQFPSAWNGDNPTVAVQCAPIGDQAGTGGANSDPGASAYVALVDCAGVPIELKVQTGKIVVLSGVERDAFSACHWVRFVASAQQSAQRTIYLIGSQGD